MILYILFIADWGYIRILKQLCIYKNNQKENSNRKLHNYRLLKKVLVWNKQADKYDEL